MKNFPHQINQIPRLTAALAVFRQLIDAEKDINDDGLVGDALARAGVYTFRDKNETIDVLLREEHRKPRGSQGTKTCARDLRRFFRLLGFLPDDHHLSKGAERLVALRHDPLSFESQEIWREALKLLELKDDSGASHPYEIMLRLVAKRPGIQGGFLGLCLEARDDSNAEFNRIDKLAELSSPAEAWAELGVSEHMSKNAVKILPALGRQLGDILESEHGYHLGTSLVPEPEEEPAAVNVGHAMARRRRYDADRRRKGPIEKAATTKSVRQYDPDIVGERLRAHEESLSKFSELIPSGCEQYEDLYDLLVISGDDALLAEVKTIRQDAVRQVRIGLGQILFYEHMLVDGMYPEHRKHKLLVVDRKLNEDLICFLERHDIGVLAILENGEIQCSQVCVDVLKVLGVNLPMRD